MKYYMGGQPVPGQGMAEMYYEVDDSEKVLRTLTYITGTEILTKIPDPIVKQLIRKEMLTEVEESRFMDLWNKES